MTVGIIGLGRMGLNLALNLRDNNVTVHGLDHNINTVKEAKEQKIIGFNQLDEFLESIQKRKIILLSLPAGDITNSYIDKLKHDLAKDDIIIDMSNSYYKDSLNNYNKLKAVNIRYFDCGISGGMNGARNGASLMVGGDEDSFADIEWLLELIACKDGYAYVGKPGSGHYLKMVHNGIEYGMMQSIGEGFQILKASDYDFDLSIVSSVWNNGSIIESYLMKLVEDIFNEDSTLSNIDGVVDSSGEGKWTIQEGLELNLPLPVITSALYARNSTKLKENFSAKVVAAMRNEFGGHKLYNSK